MKLNFAARPLLRRIDHASVKRPRIHVQADRPLVRVSWVQDAMYGFLWIDRTGTFRAQLDRIRRFQPARARLQVLKTEAVIFHSELADRRRHPAILIAMVVHRAGLSHLPTDGDQFVQLRFVDKVAGVMLAVPGQIWLNTGGIDRHLRKKRSDLFRTIECSRRKRSKFRHKFINWETHLDCGMPVVGCLRYACHLQSLSCFGLSGKSSVPFAPSSCKKTVRSGTRGPLMMIEVQVSEVSELEAGKLAAPTSTTPHPRPQSSASAESFAPPLRPALPAAAHSSS